MTYTYTDREGDDLTIEPCSLFGETATLTANNGACVPAGDLPTVVRKLYEAAGQEPPILLPRPSADDLRAHGWIDGNRVNTEAGRVAGTTTPGVARGFAACLAASADLAEAEPDPERVKQLAEVIQAGGAATRGFAQMIARAVLAAGYARSES
ncbi:hypothetical protein [Nonomuraea angiospora]|uniref:hypothetical protein n=1 Tax=Nonomuraea angiospora TaxID=46172 RepID=UPI0029B6760C|nr:hypothetical protein [Nonomuraea angiospora]MDX3109707.1 hypothetical protein [Nonomuraea angiospora]